MRRFYHPTELKAHTEFTLGDSTYHHWIKVLRAKVGDSAVLFRDGTESRVTLIGMDKKSAAVKSQELTHITRANDFTVELGLVMSRGDRMDYALQKATELGASRIQLLLSERCEVKLGSAERVSKKLNHFEQVVISACEQSGLNLVPKVLAPITLKEYCQSFTDQAVQLVLAPNNTDLELPKIDFENLIQVIIGAEGGLSDDEVKLSIESGASSWSLGQRVLRCETAPVVALALLQSAYHGSMNRGTGIL